eukprot:m.252912 g.252912  ORF g.252912 m.252912 type:complete len:263 (-) comp17191_c0_seq15:1281-2069(-)
MVLLSDLMTMDPGTAICSRSSSERFPEDWKKFVAECFQVDPGTRKAKKNVIFYDVSVCAGGRIRVEYFDLEQNSRSQSNVAIASYITAEARIHLYRLINWLQENGFQVLYCDTDSVHFVAPSDLDYAELERMTPDNVSFGDALGQWENELSVPDPDKIRAKYNLSEADKLECRIETGCYISPKTYAERQRVYCNGVPLPEVQFTFRSKGCSLKSNFLKSISMKTADGQELQCDTDENLFAAYKTMALSRAGTAKMSFDFSGV